MVNSGIQAEAKLYSFKVCTAAEYANSQIDCDEAFCRFEELRDMGVWPYREIWDVLSERGAAGEITLVLASGDRTVEPHDPIFYR